MTTNDKSSEKIIETFGNYITKLYKDENIENIKIEERPVDTSLLLVKTCQGCIEGQPNQEAHMNWGGCLSFCDERAELEQETTEEDYESDTYCSTTSYESDGENATTSRGIIIGEVPELLLKDLNTSSILTRRAANNN